METEPTEAQLSDRESLLSLITETLPISLFYTDVDHRLRFANQVYLTRLGKTAPEVLGKPMREILGDANYEKIRPYVDKALQGERQSYEVSLDYPVIGLRHVHVHYAPVADPEGRVQGLVTAIEDITERKQAEEALRASEQALRRANETLEMRVAARTAALEAALSERQELLRRIVSTQEAERRHISRELHDQTGQHLTGLALGLQSLQESLEIYGRPGAGTEMQIQTLRAIADELAQDLHRMAVDLRPTALDDLGLVPVLGTHVRQWSSVSGIPAEFDAFGMGQDGDAGELDRGLPEPIKTTVFRVVQEGLTNVARHGTDTATRATRVGVTLQRLGGYLNATVEDNGPGFSVEDARRLGRLGLVGMEERAAACGGSLQIESAPGVGTTLYLRIPIEAPPQPEAP